MTDTGTLPLPDSSDLCPSPCLGLHRLRYPYNLDGLCGPTTGEQACDVFAGNAHDENFGTDCQLCGQFVHMDTWTRIYLAETGRDPAEADQ